MDFNWWAAGSLALLCILVLLDMAEKAPIIDDED